MQIIYYATGNPGKFQEVHDYIHMETPHIDMKQFDKDIVEIQSLDQKAIAIDKAKKAYEMLQQPVLVDDAGIYFDKYKKFPGTLTRFLISGIGREGIFKLVQPGDKASFVLTMVYYYGPGKYEVFEGRCDGTITNDTHNTAPEGLPYDTLFKPDGVDVSYAQLRKDGKLNAFNYRIQALRKFMAWYEHNYLHYQVN